MNAINLQNTNILNDRYMLTERKASGGMANVYKAKDMVLERIVAVKILKEDLATNKQLVEQFLREARAVAHLSHTNVVTVYDVGSEDKHHYMVLEHVSGNHLKHHIMLDAPFSTDASLTYMIDMCNGIGHAHEHGLVHCDIKPQNILVTEENEIKVTDFGISRLINSTTEINDNTKLFGSPHYFSPEQAQGLHATPASDVYSLGIVLFEMLTGELPFESKDAQILGQMHIHATPPNVSQINPKIPDTLSDIISKLLSKEPSNRYRTAQHLGYVLDTYNSKGSQATIPYLIINDKEFDKQLSKNKYSLLDQIIRHDENLTESQIDWITPILGTTATLLIVGLLALWIRVYWKLAPIILTGN